jgi:oligosaccharide repeat unit polymerase
MVLLLVGIGIAFTFVGRWIFCRWFNPHSLYSAIWASSLALFALDFIHYYRIESEVWFIVLGGWLAFGIGSATVTATRYALGLPMECGRLKAVDGERTLNEKTVLLMGRVLWIINIITLLDAIYQVHLILRLVGSLTNVFAFANLIYSSRVGEGLPGAIPYVSSFALAGSLLAGVYTSMIGRVKLVALLPLLSVIIVSVVSMGRATMIIAGILYLSGYLLNERRLNTPLARNVHGKLKRSIAVACAIVLLLSGSELVRSNRGTIEGYAAATSSLNKMGRSSFITPSIYLYLTVHFAVLNEYLKKNQETSFPGSYSLAPLWRVLTKLGFDTQVQQYQPFYRTPERANTGTYLRELHADFGLAGIVFGPYLLGLVTSLWWHRFRHGNRLLDLVIVGHLFVVVAMSIFVNSTQLGYWLVSLLGGMGVAIFLDRHARHAAHAPSHSIPG